MSAEITSWKICPTCSAAPCRSEALFELFSISTASCEACETALLTVLSAPSAMLSSPTAAVALLLTALAYAPAVECTTTPAAAAGSSPGCTTASPLEVSAVAAVTLVTALATELCAFR